MNPDALARWRTVDALLEEALARDPDGRTAYLRATCGDDPPLYAEVVALLEREQEAERMLGESAEEFLRPMLPALREAVGVDEDLAPGTLIGPYRLERLIGRGGMGNVYLAERADGAFRKTVALKVIRRGLDTGEVLARFRRERQVLAGLDHSNVARLLDGGVTADDRPYLVMEYVEGEPVTAHCDRRRLPIERRLALFEQIGEAVAHAHRRLVVHRDIKPTNILVTADGTVKLLDFGIAKLLEQGAEEALTRTGERRLTPDYAAPEQIRGEAVTTATDVYGLGVLLYELLAGCRPIDSAGMAPFEREQALLHVEPLPPHARVTEEVAARRASSAPRLRRRLKGDLETIVLKALRKAPERRYGSVEALIDDLARHARGRPVAARPESTLYRMGRFAKRHRAGVLATAAVILALTTGLAAALWQAGQAAQERDLAREVTLFLTELFEAPDPMAATLERRDTMHVRDLLQIGAERVQQDLVGRPAMQAHMLGVLGNVHRNLGLFERAQPLLERALELRIELHGPDHPLTAESEHELAGLLERRGDYERAEDLYRRALATRRHRLGPAHAGVAASLDGLGTVLRSRSEFDAAEEAIRGALAIRRGLGAAQRAGLASSLANLGHLLQQQGRFDESAEAYRQALALRRELHGDIHPRVAASLSNLATVLIQKANLEEAEQAQSEALAIAREALGDEHPQVANSMNNLGWLLIDLRRFEEAEAVLREALELRQRIYGRNHAYVATTMSALATAYMHMADLEAAETYYRDSLELRRRLHGGEHAQVAIALTNLGVLLNRRGRYVEAAGRHAEAVDIFENIFGPDNRSVAVARGNLGEALHSAGRHAEAAAIFEQALETISAALASDHPSVIRARLRLGTCLTELRRFDEAEPHLLAALEAQQARGEASTAAEALGKLYVAWGRPADAARYQGEAVLH